MIIQTTSDHKILEAGDGKIGLTLESITRSADHLQEVRKSSLSFGDWVFVKTVKSVYRIRSLGGGGRDIYDGTGDGQRFLVASPGSEEASSPVTLVVNWTAEIKKK